jgi:tetratricopeptide (TPR) repeat protein
MSTVPSPAPNTLGSRRSSLLAGSIIILAVLAAYWNSFSGPFIFDDLPAIMENPAIRHLGSAWAPPNSGGMISRPVVNFSLAVNYAVGGFDVWGYHALNIAIHVFVALTLFGIVRRTLASRLATRGFQVSSFKSKIVDGPATAQSEISDLRFEIATDDTPLAFAVALLWAVHPLQTESVTCVVQRTELLMGLFYLLTLYCFIRGAAAEKFRVQSQESRGTPTSGSMSSKALAKEDQLSTLNSRRWFVASVISCLLGMASKEVMVSAPLMVLLYDRTFVAGTLREAWKQRRRYYIGLACTWLLLGYLVMSSGGSRGQAAGFELGITPWTYALTQCQAIIRYLKLSVWPHPLVLDYGTRVVQHPMDVLPQALLLVSLVAATIFSVRWRPALGFVGVWFFAIIAPSSSVVPLVTQTVAEHRIYLSLASVVVLAVLGGYALIGRRIVYAGAGLAVLLILLTIQRNNDYHDEATIWSDTVAKCPDNGRAHDNLGNALVKIPDRIPEAIAQFEEAARLDPDSSKTHNNLGSALLKMPGQLPEAMAQFEAALRINPDFMEAHYNLGNALLGIPGRSSDAVAQFEAALRINPDSVEAHLNLGNALLNLPGRLPEAMAQFEAAVRLDPGSAKAHYDLGNAMLDVPGRSSDAMAQYEAALRINPDSAETHENYGAVLLDLPGRLPDAIAQFEAALRINPDSAETHINLGIALLKMPGRKPDAITQLQAALRLNPDLTQVREMLNRLQDQSGVKGASPTDPSFRSNDVGQ